MEVLLPRDGSLPQAGRVVARSKDETGKEIGEANNNPYLYTRIYDVVFPDGTTERFSANRIALNLYSNIDEHGFAYLEVDDIVGHSSTEGAVKKSNGYIVDPCGKQHRRKTTKGWEFEVKWKDGMSLWIPLSDLKESNPVEIANYSRSNKIDKEPAFGWWVPYTLKKARAIISAVQSRTRKTNHKYGIEIPRNDDEVTKLDAKNRDTYWRNVVNKEMRNVAVAYQVMEENERAPNDHIYVGFHMVYEVKMDFTGKA